MWRGIFLMASVCMSSIAVADVDDEDCGTLANAFGPFDYRTADDALRHKVEDFHFTPKVERLVEGQSGTIPSDLDYTLRVFPNHPRALLALVNYAVREKKTRFAGNRHSVECWFQRAFTFQPEDGMPHAVYGYYLSRQQKHKEAAAELEKAVSLGLDTGNVNYNLGLAYFEIGAFDLAVKHAQRAYSLGFQLPGLKKKLIKSGHWPNQ